MKSTCSLKSTWLYTMCPVLCCIRKFMHKNALYILWVFPPFFCVTFRRPSRPHFRQNLLTFQFCKNVTHIQAVGVQCCGVFPSSCVLPPVRPPWGWWIGAGGEPCSYGNWLLLRLANSPGGTKCLHFYWTPIYASPGNYPPPREKGGIRPKMDGSPRTPPPEADQEACTGTGRWCPRPPPPWRRPFGLRTTPTSPGAASSPVGIAVITVGENPGGWFGGGGKME